MRPHPIAPVTEPLQYRAIGVVRGVYEPEDPEQLTVGVCAPTTAPYSKPWCLAGF